MSITASAVLAEAYMTRKLYDEKMKRSMDNKLLKSSPQQKPDDRSCDNDDGKTSNSASAYSGGGCFSLSIFKKIHPNSSN
ncbi:UNVERIFIED_CONTAM: hypothetical protein Scaly_2995700 [Sesamum calycinum]|uniref:Uncharacterized protein n=1 Tax=Sesamum calycinum TaxID=2727403 RepID=A0AAW2KG21_9LAMI